MSEAGEKHGRTLRRRQVGRVRSRSGEKTLSVVIDNLTKHPMYGKYLRRRTTLSVHDAGNVARVGDLVEIAPCRRKSKNKSWRLTRVVRASEAAGEPAADEG